MKIAVLSRVAYPLHGFGGLERHVGTLVIRLAGEGGEVTLYTAPPERDQVGLPGVRLTLVPYRFLPWPRRPGFVVIDRNTNYLIWNLMAARRLLATPVDLVHAEAGAGFGYAFLRSSQSAPFVLQAQGMEEFKAHWFKRNAYLPLRMATKYAARRAEKVIVPDRAMEEEVQKRLSVAPDQIVVIPLAIDLAVIDEPVSPEVRQATTERLGIEEKTAVVLSVGRIESNKGFSVLAAALARSKERLPHPWLWVLVGKGPQESRLANEVQKLGLAENARFAGRLPDRELAALYERADLFVHPTLYEGSSLVTLEAMAHRRPVVATAVGGIPDKVVEGKSGFLVPPGDPEALAETMVKAFSLGRGLDELGIEGRRRVEAEFSWKRRAARLVELYKDVIASSR
jgi:glycosyltransferase involved in cell wall biosynthesis